MCGGRVGLYHPAKIMSLADLSNDINLHDSHTYKNTIIPCRNCIGCRLDYSRDWANRGYLEAKYHKDKTWFVTLTYDDENLDIADVIETKKGITFTNDGTWTATLNKDHFTQFIKGLRKLYNRETGKTFKFMGCGEYGDPKKTFRPHYHLILFGLEFPTETFFEPRLIEHNFYYRNKWIERIWKHGISNITEANWQTIAYVARYITKKINGDGSEELYASAGKIKEFFRVSKGIGKQYYEEYKDKIYTHDQITVAHGDKAITSTPPKYFDNLMKKENEEKIKKIKEKREKNNKYSIIQKMKGTSKTYNEQLIIEAEAHANRAKALTRRLEKDK